MNLVKLIYDLKPDEIYHSVRKVTRVSFDIPEYTADDGGGNDSHPRGDVRRE